MPVTTAHAALDIVVVTAQVFLPPPTKHRIFICLLSSRLLLIEAISSFAAVIDLLYPAALIRSIITMPAAGAESRYSWYCYRQTRNASLKVISLLQYHHYDSTLLLLSLCFFMA